jgi:hypothetical protein
VTSQRPVGTPLSEWLTLFALVFGPGVVATLLSTPFLAAERLRALFRTLPPTDSLVPSVLLVGIGGSLPYTLGVGLLLVQFGQSSSSAGAVLAESLFGLIAVLSLVYVVVVPTVAVLVLPEVGYDWDPAEYSLATWALLIGVSAWYDAVLAVPLAFAAFFLALPL